jgi:oligopeptidase B
MQLKRILPTKFKKSYIKLFEKITEPFIPSEEKRIDVFHFLQDLKNPITKYYIEEEDKYTQEVMRKKFSKHEKRLYKEIEEILDNENQEYFKITSQEHSKDFLYLQFESPDKYPVYYRIRDSKNEKKYESYHQFKDDISLFDVVLDQNSIYKTFAETPSFFEVSKIKLSHCEKYVGYLVDTTGEENFNFFIRDIYSNEIICEIQNEKVTNFEFSIDGNSIYYIVSDHLKRPYKVFQRDLMKKSTSDVELFHEENTSYYIDISKTKDNVIFGKY